MNRSMIFNVLSRVLKKARLSVIRNSEIHATSKIESGSTVVNTVVGRHSFSGYDCSLVNCEMGSFCSIASRVTIGGGRHPIEFVSMSPVFLSHKDSVKKKYSLHDYLPKIKTFIGHDVWIGEGAFIRAGVKIGDGSVIGMGSVVTKDVPPYSIYAGNPAKLIRKRFPEDVVNKMLEIKWWEWSDEKIMEFAPYFNEPETFLKKVLVE